MSDKVIVFGASGGVGSCVAIAAHQRGVQVVLALRDPQKPIPGLSPEEESSGNYERVQADLTKPETVRAAVTKTGAKRAFTYLAHGSPDHMRATFTALKEGGIEFVVFLSGLLVSALAPKFDDLAGIPQSSALAYPHAQAEIALDGVFGAGNYVVARSGVFATNLMFYKAMISAGKVRMPSPDAKCDYIAAGDIGAVCSAVLAKGPAAVEKGTRSVNLCGPRLISQQDAVREVARAIGKEVEISGFDSEQEAIRFYVETMGQSEPHARGIVTTHRDLASADNMFAKVNYEEAIANVRKYGHKEATKFEDWLETNKARFLA
ncbi:hypothetical protein VTK26DRAFT_6206 [Humicola hyalothermophila]